MSLNYKGYNFVIFDVEEKLSSGAYFIITENDNEIYATMVKDINFSLIAKENYNYEIYLAKGNLFSVIDKIKSGTLNRFKLCTFKTNNYEDLFNDNIKMNFSKFDCKEGLYLSNPVIKFDKKFLDSFIDNL